jgi:NitT/TauT family transport system substrate-binding protein
MNVALRWTALAVSSLFLLPALSASRATAEAIKVGMIKNPAAGPALIAIDKGYFAAAGLTVEPVFFQAAEPVAIAAAGSAVDVALTSFTAASYTLGGQGVLRIVAGTARIAPGFRQYVVAVSNKASAGGLKTYADLPGHSVGITQVGGGLHYILALIAEKYHFGLASVRIEPLQSTANLATAVVGGSVDAVVEPQIYVKQALDAGQAKLLGWVDETISTQIAGILVSTKTADQRHEIVEHFLSAYRKGAQDYAAAFMGPDGRPADGPTAPEMLSLLSKALDQPPSAVKAGLSYIDPQLRLDSADVLRQIAFYRAQGMIKGTFDDKALIDARYVSAAP